MFYFFASSLLFFNFWSIHNGCCVSESGWSLSLGLVGTAASSSKGRKEGDMESGRLTESLSQGLATTQKIWEMSCLSAEEEIMLDSSRTSVYDSCLARNDMEYHNSAFWNVNLYKECSAPFWSMFNKHALLPLSYTLFCIVIFLIGKCVLYTQNLKSTEEGVCHKGVRCKNK